MSNFARSHSLRTVDERKEAAKNSKGKISPKWYTADKLVSQVYCDLINGLSSSEVLEKFANCAYDGQKKKVGMRTAQDYLRCARERLDYDFEHEANQLRADLYSKMLAVYSDAIEHNDRYNALIALDKIMKLTGCAVDKPQNAIQVNAASSGVTINFGFSNKEDDENVDE